MFFHFLLLVTGRIRIRVAQNFTDPDPELWFYREKTIQFSLFVCFSAAGVVQKSDPGLHGRRLWGHRGLHGQRALQVYPTTFHSPLFPENRISPQSHRVGTVDSNPDIAQKLNMGDISKGVANTV
jgi:hypothetical protein